MVSKNNHNTLLGLYKYKAGEGIDGPNPALSSIEFL